MQSGTLKTTFICHISETSVLLLEFSQLMSIYIGVVSWLLFLDTELVKAGVLLLNK